MRSIEDDGEIESDVTPEQFKGVFRTHPAGVALITADPGTGPVALTATSVISVSADPPVLVFSLSELASSTPGIRAASSFVIHFLDRDRHDLAVLGSTSGIDRFADTSLWTRLPTGEPIFHGVPTWIRARPLESVSVKGSTLVIALALQVSDAPGSAEPLVYHDRTWHALGDHSRLDGR